MSPNDSDENEVTLPNDTLTILNEFLYEQQKSENVPEDWQLSQFWYNEETSKRLADECVAALKENGGNIACLSCPTLISYLLKNKEVQSGRISVTLFEYDSRFLQKYETIFVHYDYKQPLSVPDHLCGTFDLIIADPPFISEECLVKIAQTIRKLCKSEATKVIVCTGSVEEELVHRLLKAKPTNFKPSHVRNLANEFLSYTNYTPLTL